MPVDVTVRGSPGKQTYPYKIKLPLLKEGLKKNGQIIKTMSEENQNILVREMPEFFKY